MGYDAGNERAYQNFKKYCSAYVGGYFQACKAGESLRRLQIGPHVIWVEYKSTESWMSNFGEGTCEIVGQELNAGYHPTIRLPLFAVDFVWGKHDLYAVDFNTAPGTSGIKIERVLSGREVCQAVEEALIDFGA
jgi:hypothetical protein